MAELNLLKSVNINFSCGCHLGAYNSIWIHESQNFYFIFTQIMLHWASQVVQQYRICLPVQETQVWSTGWEDPLEEEKATHSSILAWEIPGTESLAGYSPWDRKRSDMT